MPKFPTFPTLYDECKTISISDLKLWGYLNPNQYKRGTISWSRNGSKTGSISIYANTHIENPYIELDYQCNSNPINYRVQLVSIPSNIGKGVVWFFVCPYTGKRCRKLHLVDTYFYHRSAFKGCMYEKQTYSHKTRKLYKSFEIIFGTEKIYDKYFKTYYAGKPTKRYQKLLKLEKHLQEISPADLLRF